MKSLIFVIVGYWRETLVWRLLRWRYEVCSLRLEVNWSKSRARAEDTGHLLIKTRKQNL